MLITCAHKGSFGNLGEAKLDTAGYLFFAHSLEALLFYPFLKNKKEKEK